jgi:drug/metabolite transporter (DMT)-like permease
VTREDDIAAIALRGRRTRKRNPRWLWIAAAIIGVVCAAGFVVAMFADRAPPDHRLQSRAPARPGLGVGLVIGVAVGLAIGVAVARQRRDHSSRNNP